MSDLFPAVVSVYGPDFVNLADSPFDVVGFSDRGARRFTECRVIVHKNSVIVGADGPRGPQTVFKGEVEQVFSTKLYTRVLTTDGFLVVFAKSKGCGCGSRLKSWNPYGLFVRSD